MSRIANALTNAGYNKGYQNQALDARFGGQMGFAPELTQWVSNQQYITKNVFAIVLNAPTGFNDLEDPDMWIGTFKALIELHPIRITGLNNGINIEVQSTPVGGAGHVQEDPTNVTEAQSNVVFTWNEKYGMPVFRFLNGWVRNLIMDPHTKVAMINTIPGRKVPDMLADRYSATIAFIEPDPTHTKVVKSWVIANMYPKDSLESTGQRDLAAPGEQRNYDVAMTGIPAFGPGVDQFCQKLLDAISITGSNPYTRESFVQRIDPNVASQANGYESQAENIASQQVTL